VNGDNPMIPTNDLADYGSYLLHVYMYAPYVADDLIVAKKQNVRIKKFSPS
jgi:hypothetical protein